jgi:uncharacterized protein (TIGR02099 family)
MAPQTSVNVHSTMKRVGRAIEFLAWAAFFTAAAAVLAVRFWLLPDIERHRGRVVAALSTAVGQPVEIGGIRARWFGLNPHIRLADVRVYDGSGRAVLTLPAIDNQLSWSGLARGELKLDTLAIDDLRLQVRRDAEGVLHVAGMRVAGDARFSRWLLAQDEIVLRNAEIEWHDELRGAPPLVLSALNLRLRNSRGGHALGLSAAVPAALGSTVELRALLEGSLAEPATWTGQVFAQIGYTDLAAWRAWIDYPWRVESGRGALRAWVSLEHGEPRAATADLALAGVSARLADELAPLNVASLAGRLQAASVRGEYRIVARDFAVGIDEGGAAATSDFELVWSGGQEPRGAFMASALELEPLARMAAALPAPPAARKLLAELEPRGRLEEAHLQWRGDVQAPTSFAARGRFVDVGAAATGALPGFARISGSFDADPASARVVLATRKGELHLPRVFPQPRIDLDFLNGLIEWERGAEHGFTLRFTSLSFSNEHLAGSARGSYTSARAGPGVIDLAAQFSRADASELDRYLPHAGLMGGEALRGWLTRSVLGGRSSDVRVRLRGDLSDFPFTDASRGEFSVIAHLERAVLHYADGWPRISGIRGELAFERDAFRLTASSASTEGIALARIEASIPRLKEPARTLKVSGEARGPTADFLNFVQVSPVRQRTAGLTEPMRAAGRGELRLKLEIPLAEPASTRVQGAFEFAGNEVTVHPQLPAIEAASGRLAFTESTLTLSEAHGRLFGGPVSVHGATQAQGAMHVAAKGEAALPQFDHPWRKYLSGRADYTATLQLAKGRAHIAVRSSLQGIASTLPPPLAKQAGDTLPLQLDFLPDERVRVKLGAIAAAELSRERTAVALGRALDTPLKLPERPGTLVYGSLAALDLDRWLPLLASQPQAAAAAFDVRVAVLDVYGRRLNDVAARGAADAGGWNATLSSRELAGELAYRSPGGGRLVARLTRFRTPEIYPGAPERAALEPKDLPAMDLVAERFVLRDKELGRMELLGRREGDAWRIDKLAMANAEATLAGSGVWRSGMPTRTQLEFELNAADSGLFLERVGYPALVRGGKALLKGSLAWNGDPSLIDYASLSGAVELAAQSGQFLEIEPGFGKLISLMSLQSLPRRITLDFRDVFSKGFDFERISSSGEVRSGVMTVKDFRMRGSSAQVQMSGEVDLAQETQNMRVRVVPSLGDSASTVIALVNPLLAIPAAIAQKILKDPLGHIFAFDYAITGGWSDPKVAKLGVEAREVGAPEAGP